jgi:hypothetical protein
MALGEQMNANFVLQGCQAADAHEEECQPHQQAGSLLYLGLKLWLKNPSRLEADLSARGRAQVPYLNGCD